MHCVRIFKELQPNHSMASWALRFAQSLPQVDTVLSGMNTMEQMLDNLRDVPSLSKEEQEVIRQAASIITVQTDIPCTGCCYCESHCPRKIAIPKYFSIYNEVCRYPGDDWKIQPGYDTLAKQHGKASDCIGCKSCERHCPQHLEIANCMTDISKTFDR